MNSNASKSKATRALPPVSGFLMEGKAEPRKLKVSKLLRKAAWLLQHNLKNGKVTALAPRHGRKQLP